MTLKDLEQELDDFGQLDKRQNRDFATWRPLIEKESGVGEAILQILPNPHNEDKKLVQGFKLHWDLSRDGAFFCPETFGERCPICDVTYPLYEISQMINVDAVANIHKNLFPQMSFVSPVILKGEKETRMWSYSKSVGEDLYKLAIKLFKGGVVINDPKAAPHIKVTVESPEVTGERYNQYSVDNVNKDGSFEPLVTPVARTVKEQNALVKQARPIEELYNVKTDVELARIAYGQVAKCKAAIGDRFQVDWEPVLDAIGRDLLEEIVGQNRESASNGNGKPSTEPNEDSVEDDDLPF